MFGALSFRSSFVLATLYFWRTAREYLPILFYCSCQNHLEHASSAWRLLRTMILMERQAESYYVLLFPNVGLDAETLSSNWFAQLIHVWLCWCTYTRILICRHIYVEFFLELFTSDFSGSSVPLSDLPPAVSPLTVENKLWSAVLAAGSAVGFVILWCRDLCSDEKQSFRLIRGPKWDFWTRLSRLAKVSLF
jgi:hypothetical protein